MKKTFSFQTSVIHSTASKQSAEYFERSIEAFENGNHETYIDDLLDSIHPGIWKKQVFHESVVYTFPHGSLVARLIVREETLEVKVPFVRLPEQESIPLLRQAAVLNFKDLDLSRLELQDDGLYFTFASPLIYCHPRKVYKLLEEICHVGEKYDYEFRDQFGVERITEPCFIPYEDEKIRYTHQAIQKCCGECLEALKYFGNLHRFNDMWTVLRTTFLKLLYIAHPQGKLRNLLEKAVSDMDRNLTLSELIADGQATVEALQEKTEDELRKDLFYTEIFISDKKRSNLQKLRENYERCYKEAAAQLESGDYRKAGLKILHKLYETYYDYKMDDDLNDLFVGVLQETADQPWNVATPVLYRFLESIMQGKIRKSFPLNAA